MRFLMVALISILLSGCAGPRAYIEPCGADDYIQMPAGAQIQNVKLAYLDPAQAYTVTTQKAGVWASLDCWNRIEKGK